MPARDSIEHGTYRGYQQHLRPPKEAACPECRAANTEYHREWRRGQSEEDRKLASRRKAARRRAMEELAQQHPLEYAELLAKELVEIVKGA